MLLTVGAALLCISYLTFAAVDCEASALGLNVLSCPGPRIVSAEMPAAALALVCGGHLLVLLSAVFAFASLVHAVRSRRQKKPERVTGVCMRRRAAARKLSLATDPSVAAAPLPFLVEPAAKRRLHATPRIVEEEALIRFLSHHGDTALHSSGQPVEPTGVTHFSSTVSLLNSPQHYGTGASSPFFSARVSGLSGSYAASALAGSSPLAEPRPPAHTSYSSTHLTPLSSPSVFPSPPARSSATACETAQLLFAYSPSPLGQSVRCASSQTVEGSATKYQRAMYIPSSGDRHEEDGSLIEERAVKVRALLCVESGAMLMWRDNLRKWLSATLLRPLNSMLEENQRRIAELAALGLPTSTSAATPFNGGTLFAPKMNSAPAGPAARANVSVAQWIEHAHSDEKAQALVHQHRKLKRFLHLPGHPSESATHVRQRITAFSKGHCASAYQWDGVPSLEGHIDRACAPSDAEIMLHLVIAFFDMLLPPPLPPPDAKPATSSSPFSSTLGIGNFATPAPPTKSSTFWRAPTELCGFSSRHAARARDPHKLRSDVVLLEHSAAPERNESSHQGAAPPRYSLLCDGCEWAVAQGEHNVWECLVLLVLQRAKKNGFLGGLNLKPELYTPFVAAMTPEGTAGVKEAESPIAYHGLLSILYPWSAQLEALDLDYVTQRLERKT